MCINDGHILCICQTHTLHNTIQKVHTNTTCALLMHHYWFSNSNKCSSPTRFKKQWILYGWRRVMWELSIISVQFFSKPKTDLKTLVYTKRRRRWWQICTAHPWGLSDFSLGVVNHGCAYLPRLSQLRDEGQQLSTEFQYTLTIPQGVLSSLVYALPQTCAFS